MINLLDKIVRKRHHLFVEESDVLDVIRTINAEDLFTDMAVGNCGWLNSPKKWYIHFTITNDKWNKLVEKFNIVRVFNNGQIPNDTNGIVYTTD